MLTSRQTKPGRRKKEYMGRHRQTIILSPPLLFFFCFISFLAPSPAQAAEALPAREGGGRALPQTGSLKLLANRDYFPALQAAIEGAREEIVLAFYLFKTEGRADNYPEVITGSLIKAASRGVTVEVLMERSEDTADPLNLQNRQTGEKLAAGGISVYFDSFRTKTHTKLAVIDRRYTFIGSHNLTQAALKYNNELSVLIDSADVAAQTLRYIRRLH